MDAATFLFTPSSKWEGAGGGGGRRCFDFVTYKIDILTFHWTFPEFDFSNFFSLTSLNFNLIFLILWTKGFDFWLLKIPDMVREGKHSIDKNQKDWLHLGNVGRN